MKQIVRSLLSEAKHELAEIRQIESTLLDKRALLLKHAWRLGEILVKIKERVGRGNWQTWVCANLPELGSTDSARTENVSRCIRFYKANSNVGNSRQTFSVDSERKFMWGYIPQKERLQLKGDHSDAPAPHYLTFVNNFNKWDRQVQIGKLEVPPVDVLRADLERPLRRFIELVGQEWARRNFFDD